jgi:hypothetical protein
MGIVADLEIPPDWEDFANNDEQLQIAVEWLERGLD